MSSFSLNDFTPDSNALSFNLHLWMKSDVNGHSGVWIKLADIGLDEKQGRIRGFYFVGDLELAEVFYCEDSLHVLSTNVVKGHFFLAALKVGDRVCHNY